MTDARAVSLLPALWMLGVSAALLSGCSEGSLNPFGKPNAKAVEGDRVTIISMQQALEADESLADRDVSVPTKSTPDVWLQEGGAPSHMVENIDSTSTLSTASSTQAGDGHKWQGTLIAAPVLSTTHVYSMDGRGMVSAHPLQNLSQTTWKQQVGREPNNALNGGGIALESETLFAASANGEVAALAANSGKTTWHVSLDMPIRSAPLITPSSVIVITTGSQLFALDKQNGQTLWRHRGIQETASLLGTVTPAHSDGVVVAVYPSGEVYALSSNDGKVQWADSLLLPERTSALGTFSGVGGLPVIAPDGVVYSVSANGLLIANQLKTGMRLWEMPLSSTNTPWIAGDFLYALSTEGQLIAADRMDGRIKWIQNLPDYDAKDKDAPALKGPFMVNDNLVVMRSDGLWQVFDPKTGTATKSQKLTSGALSSPAFTNSAILVSDHGGTLYSIR